MFCGCIRTSSIPSFFKKKTHFWINKMYLLATTVANVFCVVSVKKSSTCGMYIFLLITHNIWTHWHHWGLQAWWVANMRNHGPKLLWFWFPSQYFCAYIIETIEVHCRSICLAEKWILNHLGLYMRQKRDMDRYCLR